MVLAEWLTPKFECSFKGRSWPILFTHRALLLCEQKTGIDTLSASFANPSTSLIRGLFFGALSASGADCSIEEVGDELGKNLPRLRRLLVSAWIACMADPKREPYRPPAEPSSKPPEPLTWVRKWAYDTSRDGLAIAEDKWLDMTSRQVQELEILRLKQQQREEYLTGILAAQIENFSHAHPKKPAKPQAFMMHQLDPNEGGDEDAMSVGDKIYAFYRQFPARGNAGPAPPPESRIPTIIGVPPQ